MQEQNHSPNHESLGSLVAFKQRNHNQALTGHITSILSPAGTKSLLPQTIHEQRNVPPTTFDEIPRENTSFDRSHEHLLLTFSKDPVFLSRNPQFARSDYSSFSPVSNFPGKKQTNKLK